MSLSSSDVVCKSSTSLPIVKSSERLIFCTRHMNVLSLSNIEKILKTLFAEEIVYFFVHWVVKQTFLFFYLRLSKEKIFRHLIFATMVLNFLVLVVNWLLAFFQCIPFGAILHPQNFPDAVCINSIVLFLVPAILVCRYNFLSTSVIPLTLF